MLKVIKTSNIKGDKPFSMDSLISVKEEPSGPKINPLQIYFGDLNLVKDDTFSIKKSALKRSADTGYTVVYDEDTRNVYLVRVDLDTTGTLAPKLLKGDIPKAKERYNITSSALKFLIYTVHKNTNTEFYLIECTVEGLPAYRISSVPYVEPQEELVIEPKEESLTIENLIN